MRASLSIVCLAALTLSACDGAVDSALSAEEELLLTALSGEEESMSRSPEGARGDSSYGDPMGDEASGDRPPLMRECDAEGTYTGLFSKYDGDASGDLDADEASEVEQARNDRESHEDMRRMMAFTVIHRVYDANDDKELSDAEQQALFADFTERCEVLHDRLVEDFDADGDGELNDEELQTAAEELQARHDERAEECQNEGPPEGGEGGPEGGADKGEGPPEGEGMDGERPDPRELVDQMLLAEFDTDGDGAWSGTELADMQAAIRDRITSGEHLAPEGPPPAM